MVKLEFRYYLPSSKSQELQIKFVEEGFKPWFSETPDVWQDFGNHGNAWQYGCMYLSSKRGRIIITAIAEDRYTTMGLDELVVDKGYCQSE